MKRVLSSIALAGLLAAGVAASAQTNAGAPSDRAMHQHKGEAGMKARHHPTRHSVQRQRSRVEDTTSALNRQELQRISQGEAASGTSRMPARTSH